MTFLVGTAVWIADRRQQRVGRGVLAISASPPAVDVFLNRGAQQATIEHADRTTSTVCIDNEEELKDLVGLETSKILELSLGLEIIIVSCTTCNAR